MNKYSVWALSSVAGLLAVLIPGGSFAQQRAETDGAPSGRAGEGIEEIVVTATKRSEPINKVGLSITAVSGEELLNAGVTSPDDLGKVVPGFYFTKSLYGSPVYTMRGVGFNDTALGLSPAVSIYVDEVPLPYPAMTGGATLDIDRIEALKGPQGVLFGNNSTGGAINYIAAAPTSDFHSGATLTYASFNRFDAEGYVSGPLTGSINARLAVRTEQGGAWQVSQTRPDDTWGKADNVFARLLLDWDPLDGLSFRLSTNGWHNKSENQARRAVEIIPLIPGTVAGLPVDAFVPAGLLAVFPPPARGDRAADWDPNTCFCNDTTFFQSSLRTLYEVSDTVRLTAITAYSDLHPDSLFDTDGTAYESTDILQTGSIKSFFQEVRADVRINDRLSLLGGINYEHDRVIDSLTANVNASIYQLFLGNPHGIDDTRVNTTANTYAVFSNLDFYMTDTLKLTAAGRYTADDRSADLCTYDVGGAVAALQNFFSGTHLADGECITVTNGVPGVIHSTLDQNNVSWRVGPDWQITPDMLLYATANRGFKAGGFPNVFAFDASQLKPVVQEELTAYEVGAKLGLLDRRLQVNGAIFRYDYHNKQIQGRVIVGALGALEDLINIPKSRVNGAELDLTALPASGLRLDVGATYSDSAIAGGTRAYTPFGAYVNVGGEHFPGAPAWQVNTDASYEHSVNGAIKAFGGASLVYTGPTNSAFGALPLLAVPGYSLVDFRAGAASLDNRWQAMGFVRNLTNKTYFYSTQQTIDVLSRYYGQPRIFGITVQYRY